MEDTFGKVVAIFLCAIQMFMIPLYLYNENVKRAEQTYIVSEITYNVDNFRNTGMIDEVQYNNMCQRLFLLSGNYKIIVTHCTHREDESSEKINYFDIMYYNENIEEKLEENGVYYMKKNDYLCIYVEDKKGNTIACYGGSVKNEAY